MDHKRVVVIGGGTFAYTSNHFASAAPAFGGTARRLAKLCKQYMPNLTTDLVLTRMAGGEKLETNEDVAAFVHDLVEDDRTKIIFLNAALVDWQVVLLNEQNQFVSPGRYEPRPSTHAGNNELPAVLMKQDKIVGSIRKKRKDIFLVAFKQTCGFTADQMYIAGLNLLKSTSCNLVLVNDDKTRLNMVVTPEEARYHVTHDRMEALTGLVNITAMRSQCVFTKSEVEPGEPVPWKSETIPESLRKVVDYCIGKGAYRPFRGSTAGHFAFKIDDKTFLTSQRKTNFNNLDKIGLVKVESDGPDSVRAFGAKPSVGGQSQRIVFRDHPWTDCIVHFHCPRRADSAVPIRSQYEFECGSHQCGQNTSTGLKRFGNLLAVYLDEHGPNIVFHHSIDPQEVIDFIEANFDLSHKTGGAVCLEDAA